MLQCGCAFRPGKVNIAVHVGLRTQTPKANRSSAVATTAETNLNKVGNDEFSAPMSAARQAAEAAFAAPVQRAPQISEALVTVRKSRHAVAMEGHAAAEVALAETESGQRTPRVFRVGPPPATDTGDAKPVSEPMLQGTPRSNVETASRSPPRPRRRNGEKRPGPVLHVVHSQMEPSAARVVEPRLDELMAELTAVGPVLHTTHTAGSLLLVEKRFAADWQRLAQRVDALRKELRAMLR